MSVDGSAGGPNKHANCTNKNSNKVQCGNNFSHNRHSIVSCACWNIAGWNHKSSSFRECVVTVLEYDIIGLVETHLRIGEVICVSGYMWYGNNRIVHNKRAKKGFGGVGFLVSFDFLKHYSVSESVRRYFVAIYFT